MRGVRVSPVPEAARSVDIPSPTGGLDALSPVASMPAANALALDNIFPQPGYVEIRKGHAKHNLITGAPAVESLMVYNALDATNDKMFAAAGTGFFDVTTAVTATVSTTVTGMGGLANARWQHTNFATSGGNFLMVANGADAPRKYDGATWTTASVTGVTATDIIGLTAFKSRVWLTRKGQLNPAYLELDAVQGTATPFDVQGVFTKGGFLMAIGAWSLDGGDGPDDLLAMVSSRGEVAVYSGTNPATNFVLKGVYEVGPPIGRRCLTKVGGDMAIICMDGVLPLSKALVTDRAASLTAAITAQIQPLINSAAQTAKANFGWQLIGYPLGTRAVLNVPITENTEQWQYVMNTVTGRWARFLGENANCWALYKDDLYYGGNAGKVVKANCQGFDDDGSIDFNVETAFNYCGNKQRRKNFNTARALLTTDGQITPGLTVNVDFSRTAEVQPTGFATTVGAQWGVDNWDQGVWPEVVRVVTDWVTVVGEGHVASIRMAGSIDAPVGSTGNSSLTLQLNGWNMLVVDGAFL